MLTETINICARKNKRFRTTIPIFILVRRLLKNVALDDFFDIIISSLLRSVSSNCFKDEYIRLYILSKDH